MESRAEEVGRGVGAAIGVEEVGDVALEAEAQSAKSRSPEGAAEEALLVPAGNTKVFESIKDRSGILDSSCWIGSPASSDCCSGS